jgi:hypothetical protein
VGLQRLDDACSELRQMDPERHSIASRRGFRSASRVAFGESAEFDQAFEDESIGRFDGGFCYLILK